MRGTDLHMSANLLNRCRDDHKVEVACKFSASGNSCFFPRPTPSRTDDAFHAETRSGSSGMADSSSRYLVRRLIGVMSCFFSGRFLIKIAHVPGVHVTLFAALSYPSFIHTSSNNNKSCAASRIMQGYLCLYLGSRRMRSDMTVPGRADGI